jgi:hypothetical protein
VPKFNLKDPRILEDKSHRFRDWPDRAGFFLTNGVLVVTDLQANIVHAWGILPERPVPSEVLTAAQLQRFFTHDWAQYKRDPSHFGPVYIEQHACDSVFCRYRDRHGPRQVKTCRRGYVQPESWDCPDCYLSFVLEWGMRLMDYYKAFGIKAFTAEFTDWRAFWAMYQELWTAVYQLPFPYVVTEGARDYLLQRANQELTSEEAQFFRLWAEGQQQQQIAEATGKSIGYVNTRLTKIREGPMGLWYEDFVKGEGHRAGHGEPDRIGPDGVPENLKCVGDKRITKIQRDKLQPEIQHATAHGTRVRIRVYNIVHDKEQVLDFAPLDIPIEVKVDW